MLERLKRRLGLADDAKEKLLEDLLEGAWDYVLAYTGRRRVPEPLWETVLELAAISYNRLGMEGETAHSEGGVSVTAEGLPQRLAAALNQYRHAKVGG